MHLPSRITALSAALLLGLGAASPALQAQALSSAFTYQGELRSAGSPATASFDMEFRLFRSAGGSDQVGPTVTRSGVPVSGGLFSVALDFGAAQFAGDRQWLEVRIRPAGSGSFETLSPRTEVTAAPYAWSAAVALANSVTSTSIVDGSVGSVDINATQVQRRVTGTCPTGQYVRVVNQDGSVTCGSDAGGSVTSIATGTGLAGGPISTSGTISIANGGVGATQIDSSQVQRRISGSCPAGQYVRFVNQDGSVTCGTDAVGSPGWSLTGNAGTNPNTNFIGTTDLQPFSIRVGNASGLRLSPAGGSAGTPALPRTINVIGGSQANGIGNNAEGATIAGGGGIDQDIGSGIPSPAPNIVNANFGTIGGGSLNLVSGQWSTIGGGYNNVVSRGYSTIGGGVGNRVSGAEAVVAGGAANNVSANWGAVGGGNGNRVPALWGTVSGGLDNAATGIQSSVVGGFRNCAGGELSWAGGHRAKVRRSNSADSNVGACLNVPVNGTTGDQGTFVWADSQEADFISSGPNQFLIRAQGGIGLNSNGPPAGIDLEVRNREGSGSNNVDIYLRTAAHNRGINLAMLPTAGAAEFRISQSTGTGFTDRLNILSNGDVEVTAQAFKPGGGAWANPSDARLKSDVSTLSGALDRLLSLRGVEYHYLKDRTPAGMYLPGAQIGFIAQEVETVFPDWVSETGAGYKTVGPRGFEALTVEALRELRAESATLDQAQNRRIATLEAENAELKQRLARLEALLDR